MSKFTGSGQLHCLRGPDAARLSQEPDPLDPSGCKLGTLGFGPAFLCHPTCGGAVVLTTKIFVLAAAGEAHLVGPVVPDGERERLWQAAGRQLGRKVVWRATA